MPLDFKARGKFSRSKGGREERGLVFHLNELGFSNVKRVPLSGASFGFKFDVLGTHKEKEYSFELKTRKESYTWFYSLYKDAYAPVLRLSIGNTLVAIGYDPKDLLSTGFDSVFLQSPLDEKSNRRLVKLKDVKKEADFLVLKDNNRKRLFFRFWN